MQVIKVLVFVLLLPALLIGWWELKYGFATQFIQAGMPQVDSKAAAKSQLEHSAGATLNQKIEDAESAYRKGQITLSERDARIAQAKADDDHDLEVAAILRPSHNSAPALSPAPAQTANLEDFRVLKSDADSGEYEFQLDARSPKQELPIFLGPNDQVESWAEGRVCSISYTPCNGPNGHDGRPLDVKRELWERYNVADYPVSGGYFDSLVLYQGDQGIPIGDHKVWPGNGSTVVGPNSRTSEVSRSTGGFKIKIKVTKKGGV